MTLRPPRAILIVALLLVTGVLAADEVILKDGRRFTGEILKDTDASVTIRTVGGVLVFDRDEVITARRKADPRKVYKDRVAAIHKRAVAGRLELARWCLTHDRHADARTELEHLLLIDPTNFDAQSLLGRVAKRSGTTFALRAELVLTDGSQVKGKLINPLITLETAYGLLHIPAASVATVEIGHKADDVVETRTFRAKGKLAEELFVIDSKLGRLTVVKKDVRSLVVYQPTPEELADIEFAQTMRDYNDRGLDVVLVVDTTDSMAGILRHLRQQSPDLCRVVRTFVPNAQFGVVAFRDHKKYDPGVFEYVTKLQPLTANDTLFRLKLTELRARGGGDVPEAVFDALAVAMTKAGWRPKSHRVIILIGDAPPHDQNKGLAKTYQLVGDWHKNTHGILHTVDTTGYNRLMAEFKQMATSGGGKSLILNDEKRIVRDIVPLILGVQWRDRFDKAFEGDKPATPPKDAAAPPEPDTGTIKG